MKKILYLFCFFSIFWSCNSCYQCEYQFYKNAEDQINQKDLQKFNSNKVCKKDYDKEVEALFSSLSFPVVGSLICKRKKG